MKFKAAFLIIVLVTLLSCILTQLISKPIKDRTVVLSTDESIYLNWDSVCIDPWDSLIINQTDNSTLESAPHSVSFYYEKKLVQSVKIPETIVFWMTKDELVTILELQREQSLFIYQGIQHLSSAYTNGVFETMTIGDGFFAKYYIYQGN